MTRLETSESARIWVQVLLIHTIGLPLALGLGYLAFWRLGPMAGAGIAVGATSIVIVFGVWHITRKLLPK